MPAPLIVLLENFVAGLQKSLQKMNVSSASDHESLPLGSSTVLLGLKNDRDMADKEKRARSRRRPFFYLAVRIDHSRSLWIFDDHKINPPASNHFFVQSYNTETLLAILVPSPIPVTRTLGEYEVLVSRVLVFIFTCATFSL